MTQSRLMNHNLCTQKGVPRSRRLGLDPAPQAEADTAGSRPSLQNASSVISRSVVNAHSTVLGRDPATTALDIKSAGARPSLRFEIKAHRDVIPGLFLSEHGLRSAMPLSRGTSAIWPRPFRPGTIVRPWTRLDRPHSEGTAWNGTVAPPARLGTGCVRIRHWLSELIGLPGADALVFEPFALLAQYGSRSSSFVGLPGSVGNPSAVVPGACKVRERRLGQLVDLPGHLRLFGRSTIRLRRSSRIVATTIGFTVLSWTGAQALTFRMDQGKADLVLLRKTRGLMELGFEQGMHSPLTPFRDIAGLGDNLALLVVMTFFLLRATPDPWDQKVRHGRGGSRSNMFDGTVRSRTTRIFLLCGCTSLYAIYRLVCRGMGSVGLPLGGCLILEVVLIPLLMLVCDGFLLSWLLTELRDSEFEAGKDRESVGNLTRAIDLTPAGMLACVSVLPARIHGDVYIAPHARAFAPLDHHHGAGPLPSMAARAGVGRLASRGPGFRGPGGRGGLESRHPSRHPKSLAPVDVRQEDTLSPRWQRWESRRGSSRRFPI